MTTRDLSLTAAAWGVLLCSGWVHGASALNPLAGPGAQAPAAPTHGKPQLVAPGKPLQLRWTKRGAATPSANPPQAARTIAGPNDVLAAVSPEGDAVALVTEGKRLRTVQLLTGRVSPFLEVGPKAQVSLSVSGFAVLIVERQSARRYHTWSGRARGERQLASLSRRWTTDAGLTKLIWEDAKRPGCLRMDDLMGATASRCLPGALAVAHLRISDSGQTVWTLARRRGPGAQQLELYALSAQDLSLVGRIPLEPNARLSTQPGSDAVWVQRRGHGYALVTRRGATLVAVPLPLAGAWMQRPAHKALDVLSGHTWRQWRGAAPRTMDALVFPTTTRLTWVPGGQLFIADLQGHAEVWRPGSWAPMGLLPKAASRRVTRSRVLWRDRHGSLLSVTWEQLAEGGSRGSWFSGMWRRLAMASRLTPR